MYIVNDNENEQGNGGGWCGTKVPIQTAVVLQPVTTPDGVETGLWRRFTRQLEDPSIVKDELLKYGQPNQIPGLVYVTTTSYPTDPSVWALSAYAITWGNEVPVLTEQKNCVTYKLDPNQG